MIGKSAMNCSAKRQTVHIYGSAARGGPAGWLTGPRSGTGTEPFAWIEDYWAAPNYRQLQIY